MKPLSILDINLVFNHLYNVLLPIAVATMWFYFKSKSDKCDLDRAILWKAILKLSGIVHAVQECPVNGCGLRKEAFDALQDLNEDLAPEEVKNRVMTELNIKEKGACYHVPA